MLTGQIVNGTVSGAMYALVAIGFTLVIGVLDKLNFAHPEVLMFGGFVGILSVGSLPLPVAFVLALLLVFRFFKPCGSPIKRVFLIPV